MRTPKPRLGLPVLPQRALIGLKLCGSADKQITLKPGKILSRNRDLPNPATSQQGKLLMAPFLNDITGVTGL